MSWGAESTLGAPKMSENGRRSCSMHDSVHSLKALYPNAVHTVKNQHVLLLDNNNNSYDLDIDCLDYLILKIT